LPSADYDIDNCFIADGWYHLSYSLAHDGSKVLMITNKDAPRYKLVTIDISAGTPEFVDLIHEDPEALLVSVDATPNGKLFVVYQRNVQDELYIYSRMGKREARLVPDFVGSITVSSQLRQTEVFVTLTGFTTPRIVMVYNLALPEAKRALVHWRATVTKGLNPLEFSTEQVWYSSKDETRIPMFIVKHVDTKLNGTAPAIQYGYGGFDHCVTPSFMPDILTFLKHYGGVYAAVNIRGGGEFGDEWHQGGIKEKKVSQQTLCSSERADIDGATLA
jgi:prolyl oligopeptidase